VLHAQVGRSSLKAYVTSLAEDESMAIWKSSSWLF